MQPNEDAARSIVKALEQKAMRYTQTFLCLGIMWGRLWYDAGTGSQGDAAE